MKKFSVWIIACVLLGSVAYGAGNESGGGIPGPEVRAAQMYLRSPEVDHAFKTLLSQGYQFWQPSSAAETPQVTIVSGNCYAAGPTKSFQVCDRTYLLTQSFQKDDSPARVVAALVVFEATSGPRLIYLDESRFADGLKMWSAGGR